MAALEKDYEEVGIGLMRTRMRRRIEPLPEPTHYVYCKILSK